MKLIALNDFGIVRISGEDASSFLQRQFTNNIDEISVTNSSFGAYLSAKGRVLVNFLIVSRDAGEYELVMPKDQIEPFVQRLRMFVLRDKVQITITDETDIFGVIEPQLNEDCEFKLPQDDFQNCASKFGTWIRLPADRERFILLTGQSSFPSDEVSQDEIDHWLLLDIKAGIFWIREITREMFVPQALNMDLIGAVSFTKGCYPGQEIVARLHYRGGVNHRMFRAASHAGSESQSGAKIKCDDIPGNQTGTVVDSMYDAALNNQQLLVSLPLRFLPSANLSLTDESRVELMKNALPYSIPESV